MNSTIPGFTIATQCRAKIDNTKINERSREWVDLNGKSLTDNEMMNLMSLSLISLKRLWLKHEGNCEKIINRQTWEKQ